ncbi:MAG TPA: ATP-binding protein [Parvibaculum sp.]
MSNPGPLSERAIILAPGGRDGHIAASILREVGFPAEVHPSLLSLCAELKKGAGLAIIADEAIRGADLRPLASFLAAQPAWSDFPIVLLTQRGGGPERNPAAARLAEILGNVSFLERPFHPTTLASVVRAAIRGRRRQYEARDHLQELGEGEKRLQTALKAGRLGSWSLDLKNMALHTSDTCKTHFGLTPDQPFKYDYLRTAIHPDDFERREAVFQSSLLTGQDYAIEYRNIWPDGSIHWVDVRARAIRDAAGEIAQLVGVSIDITARKTSEIERERLLAEIAAERAALTDLTATLEHRVEERTVDLLNEIAARERAQEQLFQAQKMESIGQLTGGVAHDFNNLLMAVMGNLDILRKRLPNDPRALRLIDGALQGARRGASLTQRMLAFARQQDLKTTSTDLVSLLHGMRDLLDRTLGPHIAFTLRIPENLPLVEVDANQVELAVLNLVINARDAMPGGGSIDVIVDQASGNETKNLRASSYLRVQIVDNGSGMDALTLKKAIEPFFSTKPTGKGTGLGLSMVHGLAVQLGGLLDLASEPGRGTTATLWLPVATSEAPVAVEAAAEIETETGKPATILVVDDDALIAMSTVDMLEDLGHKVIEANSGQAALDLLEKGSLVDLVITDQAMPGMTGTEFAKIVRARYPALPILLATGYAELTDEETSNLPRLAKPYQQAQLRAHVNRLLADGVPLRQAIK